MQADTVPMLQYPKVEVAVMHNDLPLPAAVVENSVVPPIFNAVVGLLLPIPT